MPKTKSLPSKPVQQRTNNFFQKPRKTPNTNKAEPKSSRASEATGNEFFLKPKPNRRNQTEVAETNAKKPFDKKTWRLQRYSKKYKLDQWENRRKHTMLREYYQQLDPNEKKFDVDRIYNQYEQEITTEDTENDNNVNADTATIDNTVENQSIYVENSTNAATNSKKGNRKNAFQKARVEFERLKDEKRLKREEIQLKKQQKEEKQKLYKAKKAELYKRLNKKTKRGQPVMKDRLEILLEQIQRST